MSKSSKWKKELYSGLQALATSSFPKRCNNCGRIYETAENFIQHTKNLQHQTSGLKQSYDDDDSIIVELYRNCECGSTLLDFFTDRRCINPQSIERRRKFDALLDLMVKSGLSSSNARIELLKLMRGEESELLEELLHKE